MTNRCDSVDALRYAYHDIDALMYAYYEFMKMKEANKMLEKNKDYVEFSMWSYMATHKPGQCTDINITGISPEPGVLCTNNPFDIPCDVVVVPKRAFDRLQADNQHHREKAKQSKQWEHNYELLLRMTGFNTLEELTDYIHDAGKNSKGDWKTLKEIADDAKYDADKYGKCIDDMEAACQSYRDTIENIKKKLEECEKDYISERDKAETLDKENEDLKKKLAVPDPFGEYKELLEKLHSKEDVEEFEWALNHVCGGHASVNGWMVTAKLWRRNYETLSKFVGFSSAEEIEDYLTNEAKCDTLHEAISKLKDQVKYTCDEWKDMKKKAEALQTENKQLKKKLEEFAPVPGYRNFLKALYPAEDVEKLVWATEQLCCGRDLRPALQVDLEYYRAFSSAFAKSIYNWKEATGCLTPEEAKANRDALRKKIDELRDENKKWQTATGYFRPEDISTESMISKSMANEIKAANEKLWSENEKYEKENADLYAEIRKWKDMTKCETPEAAATWITSYESACGRGNRLAEMVEKLKEEVVSWKNVTGYSTPEGFLAAKINDLGNDYLSWKMVTGCSCPKDLSKKIVEWEKILTPHMSARDLCSAMSNAIEAYKSNIIKWLDATGCDTPEKAKERIKALNERIDESEAVYNHLLMLTGFGDEGEIEDALGKCDHSTLRKALVDYEFNYESLLKLTGYKSEQYIRDALRGENYQHITMRDLINTLKRNSKFTESNWQKVTGFSTPEKCSSYIDRLEKKLEDIKNLTEED